jgi:hypothetical protein
MSKLQKGKAGRLGYVSEASRLTLRRRGASRSKPGRLAYIKQGETPCQRGRLFQLNSRKRKKGWSTPTDCVEIIVFSLPMSTAPFTTALGRSSGARLAIQYKMEIKAGRPSGNARFFKEAQPS